MGAPGLMTVATRRSSLCGGPPLDYVASAVAAGRWLVVKRGFIELCEQPTAGEWCLSYSAIAFDRAERRAWVHRILNLRQSAGCCLVG